MVLVKANKDLVAGIPPSAQLIAEMMRFNEDLVKAFVMLAGEGLRTGRFARRTSCRRGSP
jgi:hypothetical protein